MPLLPKRIAADPLSTYPIGPLHAVTLSDAIDEFRGRYNGEWRVVPQAHFPANPTVDTGMGTYRDPTFPTLGRFYAVAGLWGEDRTASVVFEYGATRGNVSSYTFNVDRQQVATRVYVPRVGFPEPGRTGVAALIISDNNVARDAFGARYDAWVEPGEIVLDPQRQALADFHRDLRSGPRRIVSFTPSNNNEYQPWVDYDVGDFVRFRALDAGVVRLNLAVRIYGITATIDTQGNESVTLTTAEEATS